MKYLSDIDTAIENGGWLRFEWSTCTVTLFGPLGDAMPVDGRSYQAFTEPKHADKFKRREFGSVETKDLIIEWWNK